MSALSKLIIAFIVVFAAMCVLVAVYIIYINENTTEKITINGHVAVPEATANNLSHIRAKAGMPTAQGMATASKQATRLSTTRCDPFACKPVAHRPVKIVSPSRSGWYAEPTEQTMTDDNGDYSITVDKDVLTSGGPVFVAVMDPTEAYPLMATIPGDLIYAGTIELAIDRTTTAAAIMHCPGGMNPPPRGSYCYSDPHESADDEQLYAKIDLYFDNEPSTSVDPENYLPKVSSDPDVQDEADRIMSENDQPEGFQPITIGDAHRLEDFGRVILGEEEPPTTIDYTTTQPRPTSPPPTPRPTSPPRTTPPGTLPNGFPDLPENGQYSISVQVCSYGGSCQAWTQAADAADIDVNELIYYLNNANSYCNNEGVRCRISYSGWDGRTFTMTASYQVCYQGTCSEASRMYYRITKVG